MFLELIVEVEGKLFLIEMKPIGREKLMRRELMVKVCYGIGLVVSLFGVVLFVGG